MAGLAAFAAWQHAQAGDPEGYTSKDSEPRAARRLFQDTVEETAPADGWHLKARVRLAELCEK